MPKVPKLQDTPCGIAQRIRVCESCVQDASRTDFGRDGVWGACLVLAYTSQNALKVTALAADGRGREKVAGSGDGDRASGVDGGAVTHA